jgi:hypothetical protein
MAKQEFVKEDRRRACKSNTNVYWLNGMGMDRFFGEKSGNGIA